MSSNYYAVKVGHHPGIYTNWNDCKQSITGFSNPVFRKFGTIEEAQNFINSKKVPPIVKNDKNSNKKTYFNAERYLGRYQNLIEGREFNIEIPYAMEKWNTYNNELFVFTDGSFKNNGQELNSGLGVFLGPDCINVKELYNNKTNNQCELAAVDIAIKIILKYYKKVLLLKKPINIVSDSEYTIKCCTEWIKKWKTNNWKTSNGGDVKNRELIESIDNSFETVRKINSKVPPENAINLKFMHVRSHQEQAEKGTFQHFIWEGNMIADGLATNIL